MNQLAGVIGKYVAAYPEQWLMLQPAWCEDSVAQMMNDEIRMTNQ